MQICLEIQQKQHIRCYSALWIVWNHNVNKKDSVLLFEQLYSFFPNIFTYVTTR